MIYRNTGFSILRIDLTRTGHKKVFPQSTSGYEWKKLQGRVMHRHWPHDSWGSEVKAAVRVATGPQWSQLEQRNKIICTYGQMKGSGAMTWGGGAYCKNRRNKICDLKKQWSCRPSCTLLSRTHNQMLLLSLSWQTWIKTGNNSTGGGCGNILYWELFYLLKCATPLKGIFLLTGAFGTINKCAVL